MGEAKKLDLTQLVEELGGFGRFQVLVFLLGCYACAMPGILVVNLTFVAYEPEHRCLVPTCESSFNTSYEKDFLNFTTPFDHKKKEWEKCKTWGISHDVTGNEFSCNPKSFQEGEPRNCSDYVYNTTLFASSTVTEFDLVCDRAWLQPTANMMYMLGMLFGAIILGDLADRVGRKKGLILSVTIFFAGGVVSAMAGHYYVFLASRLVTGVGSVAIFQIAFILVLEYFPPRWRTFVGILIEIPFALGEASVAIFAYYIREWRWLQGACMAPSLVILLLYWWIMPESFRWLISNGRTKEAMKILRRIEKFNNVTISEEIYKSLESDTEISDNGNENSISSPAENSEGTSEVRKRTVLDLLRHPNTCKRTLNLIFSWTVVTLSYYGLSLHSAKLAGNLWINFVAIMLIEVPSYLFAFFVLDRLGRKGTLCLVMFVAGVASVANNFTPPEMNWLLISFSMTGKFGVSAGFAVVYIYTAEIFPTTYRSIGLGVCSMSARLGGIIAPYIAALDHEYQPLLIFGLLALASSFLTLLLPETVSCELPQTLKESEDFGTEQSIFFFTCCTRKRKLEINPKEK